MNPRPLSWHRLNYCRSFTNFEIQNHLEDTVAATVEACAQADYEADCALCARINARVAAKLGESRAFNDDGSLAIDECVF